MSTAVIIEQTPENVQYHNAKIVSLPRPVPKAGEALIKIKAVALNHREIWILDGNYPKIEFNSVLGSDAVGTITEIPNGATTTDSNLKVGDRVLIMPSSGWISNPRGPEVEANYAIRGGSKSPGVFTQYSVNDLADVFKAPEHLTDIEAAALSLSGLTAYRAVFTKGQITKGQNVLVTGIGGGVALFALQYAAAVGANVYVTSSDDKKIERAKQYGAKGGVNYRHANWDDELLQLTGGTKFDVVIDSANGQNTVAIISKVLAIGGSFVSFGQTAGSFELGRVYFVRHIEIKGTTMGSRVEYEQMLRFVTEHQIRPVVGDVFEGIDQIPKALQHLRDAKHFGKVVITIDGHQEE
ncbi:hypothetical protein BGW42_000412 [Actinomortierella wolfii]|nr:hypothetical protein BGW42_000412 [Actinomortierella wolfii]